MSSVEVVGRIWGVPHAELTNGAVTFLATGLPFQRGRKLDIKEAKKRAELIAASRPREIVTADADVGLQ